MTHPADINLVFASQARERHCPHIDSDCIAAHCMAWRFVHVEIETSKQPPPGTGWVEHVDNGTRFWTRPHPALGYCGLAGRP